MVSITPKSIGNESGLYVRPKYSLRRWDSTLIARRLLSGHTLETHESGFSIRRLLSAYTQYRLPTTANGPIIADYY